MYVRQSSASHRTLDNSFAFYIPLSILESNSADTTHFNMVFLSAKKVVPAAAAVGAIGLAISGSTASPIYDLAKREIEVAVWGSNLGNLIAAVKDYLRDINAYVSIFFEHLVAVGSTLTNS